MIPLTEAQRRLVEDHAYLVGWAVGQSRGRLGFLDADDRRSLANEALVDLARRFDPGRGKAFKSFVAYNVVHTMVTLLRRETGRRRVQTTLFDPTEALDREIVAAAASFEFGFERVEDRDEARQVLAAVLPALRPPDRFVAVEVGSGATLRQAGARLGVTESRACQILAEVRSGRQRVPGCCGVCGRSFKPYPGKRYCGEDCKRQARRLSRRRVLSNAICEFCGCEYRQSRNDQRYCSPRCGKNASWHRLHPGRRRRVA